MFKNSWGMGPFYSYNKNFENLKETYNMSNVRDLNFEEWYQIKEEIHKQDEEALKN